MIPADHDSVPNSAAENYRMRLHPWCIIRLLPKMQRIVVQRFRTRTQAEEYLKVLQNLMPKTIHQIVFDPETE